MRRLSCMLVLVILLLPGCVERYMLIRAEPGTKVWIDGKEAGSTDDKTGALEIPFDFYGSHDVTLRKYGRWSKSEIIDCCTPWYQYFPIDIIPDLLLPLTIVDEHEFSFELEKIERIVDEALMERARDFRENHE